MLLLLTACAHPKPHLWSMPAEYPHGYLHSRQAPHAAAFLPSFPVSGSWQDLNDKKQLLQIHALATPARREQAAEDAQLGQPDAPKVFECALGKKIDPQRAPVLATMLARIVMDVETVQKSLKVDGQTRIRPYVDLKFQPCVDGQLLAKTSSYPSGHAAIGWAWALILSELQPNLADVLLHRGYDYGESRLVCGFHYPTDVAAGRLVGSVVFSALQTNSLYKNEAIIAKREILMLRLKSSKECQRVN